MKGKKKIYWRFPVLFGVLLLIAAGCVVYVAVEGNTYTARLDYVINDFINDEDISATVKDETIVKIDRVYFDDKHIVCVDLHSVGQGSTTVTVHEHEHIVEDGVADYDFPLYVNEFGTIFETDRMNFDGFVQVEMLIIGGLGLVLLTTGITFIECFFKARFSYAAVACGGVALFTLFVMLLSIYEMQWMNTFLSFLMNIADSGFDFALLTSPFMFFLALAIAVSNIWLLRHEGRRPQNMLGIALALAWVLGFAGIAFLIRLFVFSDGLVSTLALRLAYSVGYVLTFLECMLLSTIVCAFFSTKYRPPYNKDFLIILGCGIRKDGTLTPILRGRVDAAITFERAQFAKTGKHAKFVPSGGQGSDEVISESEAMKRYLLEQGYPEEQILMEDKSTNTYQNIQFSRDVIMKDAGTLENIKAGFATTNYHIFRGYILSKKHGLDAQGISAKTKWYFYPNAFLREFAGLLYEKKWFITASIFLLLALYTAGVHFLTNYI